MKKSAGIIVSLLFLSPVLGELVSGSSPPVMFFKPVNFLLLVLLYGCGTLLIREARARWKLQWSVAFLAVAYGVVEEGLATKSFFNPEWMDLQALSGYGMLFGVQWVWAIQLIVYHATVSTIIPIAIVDLLWPQYKYVPLLRKRGLILNVVGISLATMIGIIFFGTEAGGKHVPYYPNPLLLVGSFFVVGLLVWLTFRFRGSRISMNGIPLFPVFAFGLLGFLMQGFNLISPSALAQAHMPATITIIVQLAEVTLILLFMAYQIYHQNVGERHIVALIFGSIFFWILLAPVQEFRKFNPDPTQGMLVVGIVSLILLILWRHAVLKKQNS